MLRKTILGLAAAAALITAGLAPTTASAHYYGYGYGKAYGYGYTYGYRPYFKPYKFYKAYNYYAPAYGFGYRFYRYGY
jgi:hypothetical protein